MEQDYLVRFDYAIKKLLRNRANFAILEGFIEVFLNKKCKIQEILESEANQDNADDKFNRVDIKAKDTNGDIFIVEVQTTRYTYYLERILYGVSKAITEQIGEGKKYGVIKQVYSISIVYYDLGEGDDYFYECKSDFYGVHSHNILKLSRREELSVEELKKGDQRKFKYTPKTASDIFPKYYLIRINSYRKIVADAIDEWMTFLKDNSIKEDTKVPGLIEAKEQLKISKMTPAERLSYDRHLDAVELEVDALTNSEREGEQRGIKKGIAQGIAQGISQGISQGLAQGRQETLLTIARQMKAHGDDTEYISLITHLTPDEINNL